MTTILLVRHGESAANRDEIFAGNYDAELMDRGIEQAKLTAGYIKDNYKVDAVYASDLKRAFKTAECIADAFGLSVEPSRNLREISAGKWDGVKFSEIYEKFPEEFSIWMNDLSNAACPDGESVLELGARVFNELSRIARENDGKTVAIGTHATPVRSAYCLAMYGTLERVEENPWPSNASVSEIFFDNGKWSCGKYSIDEHMGAFRTFLPDDV